MKALNLNISDKAAYLIAAIILFFIPCSGSLNAQTRSLYNYQQLSHLYYQKQKDSITKAWVCPAVFSKKTTQKKYKEYWDARTEFVTNAISNKNFVHEKEVFDYVYGIINQLVSGNIKQIPQKPVLLIDRSSTVNAYAVGGNIIAVNLGLISFSGTREEIALVLAHELSHNILDHADRSMKAKAEWFTSDEYISSVNAVLDSKYERFSRLNKVFEGYSFSRSKHQRYKEGDADSLAVVLLKNSGISFDPAYFLRLDSADMEYQQPLKTSVKNYFTTFGLPFEEIWTQKRGKGLSTRNYSFKTTTGLADSLKTHPDCKARYEAALSKATEGRRTTVIPADIREKAMRMMIWNMFDNHNLTACLYRVLQQKDKGNTDEWYDMMLFNIFSGLNYSDKRLDRFNAIGVTPKEYISKDYYELQNMLEQMPRETIQQYCRQLDGMPFWKALPADAKAFRSFLNTLNFDVEAEKEKGREDAAGIFTANNSTSMYCEFADHFKKK